MQRSITGFTVKDVAPADFVSAYSAHLKTQEDFELPKWVDIAKTGTHKELAPYDPDWFYVRVASLARKVYLRQGTGVGAYRKVYGGSKSNGTRPSHFRKASGGVIRAGLKQLEKLGIIEKHPNGGRRVTRKGQVEMDTKASEILASQIEATGGAE
uniref:Uncharacterized protein n=1 Tax=Rhodosorus marinus TaxID=101924 RepID=A0A6T6M2D6_9RHOD|mmetsp:Transcript_2032/g.3050  ORF Transcript_2032/g.3050 Transcript_2032/m.3050 type:complete len:155 (+) Transcript_2032:139-603(+)